MYFNKNCMHNHITLKYGASFAISYAIRVVPSASKHFHRPTHMRPMCLLSYIDYTHRK